MIICPTCGMTWKPRDSTNPINCKCKTRFTVENGEVVILALATVAPPNARKQGGAIPGPTLGRLPQLTEWEKKQLFGDSDPTLCGNRIKAVTDALGIPPCGGCEKRRQWINNAHAWLRGKP